MKKLNKLSALVLVVLTLTFSSCHDDLDLLPKSNITPENFFNTLEEAEIAVNGMYDVFHQQYFQYYVKLTDHASHVSTTNLTNFNQNKFAHFTFSSGESDLEITWLSAYQGIYRANVIINRIEDISLGGNSENQQEREQFKNRLKAEALFVRALLHFNLVRFFGDIPLIIEELEDFENTSAVFNSRTPSNLVYDQIIEDLQFAEQHLYIPSWASGEQPSYLGDDKGRATIGAAKGLLAKVYLARAGWPLNDASYMQAAYDKAKEVVDLGHYMLDSNYHYILSPAGESSHEWLFMAEFDAEALQGSVYGGVQNPSGPGAARDRGFGRLAPTLQFYRQFDQDDARITSIAKGPFRANNTINEKTNFKTQWKSYKYRFDVQPDARFLTDMNAPILRYADVLLIHAETANALGFQDEAITSLNLIRERARNFGAALDSNLYGTAPIDLTNSYTQEELADIIFWDRAKELCFEGHSRFDLVRAGEDRFISELSSQTTMTNINNAGSEKPLDWIVNLQPFKMLFPIPEAEVGANPNMVQNPGY